MNLKLKAVKTQLTLDFLLSIILHLFLKKASQQLHALARIAHYMDQR